MIPASRLRKIVKNSQQAITARALVAAWRHSTENRRDSPSQKQIYTPVKRRKTRIHPTSSKLGGIPMAINPTATASPPMANTMEKITAAPARNFPLITLSL